MCRGGFRRAHTLRSGPVAVSKPLLGPATASAVAGGVGSRGAHCRAVVCNCRPRARQRCRASRYLTSRKPFPAYSARYVPSRALPLNCVVTSPRAVMRTNRPTVLLELFEFVRDPELSYLTRTTPVTAFAKAAPSSASSSRYSPSSCLRANQLERKREGGQGNPSPAPAPFFEFSRNSAVAALLSAGASGDGCAGAADGW